MAYLSTNTGGGGSGASITIQVEEGRMKSPIRGRDMSR